MTLYWMLTGVLPFDAQNQYDIYKRVVECRIPNPMQYNPELPPQLVEVLRVALQADPALRYQDAYELRTALEQVLLKIAPGYGQNTLRAFIEQVFGATALPTGNMPQPRPQPTAASRASILGQGADICSRRTARNIASAD